MVSFKRLLLLLITIVAVASCKNGSNSIEQAPEGFAKPVSEPLKFNKPKKIKWDAIKAVNVQPVIKKLDLNNIPSKPYDTAGFKPFKYPVEETKFDDSAIPQKDFDLDKIPSKPLKFKTFILPPPKLIKAGVPQVKNIQLSLYGLGEAQGLQGAIVTDTYTDRDGLLWIATDQGIYRYDGENLSQYIFGPIDKYIIGMLQDKEGRIWMIALEGGVEVLDFRDGTLRKTNKSIGFEDDNNLQIMKDKQQRIWISFGTMGIDLVDSKTLSVKWIRKAQGLSNDAIGGLAQDVNNDIWISTLAGLNVIDQQHKKIKYIQKAQGLKTDSTVNVMFDKDGRIISTAYYGGLNVIDTKNKTVQYIKDTEFKGSEITTMALDNQGLIWASALNNGITILNLDKRIERTLKATDGLAGDGIVSVRKDYNNQFWIVVNAGLNLVASNKTVLAHIGTAQTNTLMEDNKGLIWQGTSKGIDILSKKDKTLKHISTDQGLGNELIETIKTIDGKIFIGTNGGLDILDSSKTTITHLGKEQGLKNVIVLAFDTDSADRIWIAGDKGLEVYDPKTKTVKSLGKEQGIDVGRINDLKKDSRGRIWISMQSAGIQIIDPSDWSVKYFKNKNEILSGSYPVVLLPDNKGDMWLGGSDGIYIADLNKEVLTSFSTKQGLINNNVTTILQRGSTIYAGTRRGISVIETPKDGLVTTKAWPVKSFSIIQSFSGSSLTDMVTKDGNYWFGDKGLSVLDLSKIDSSRAPVYVTAINTMDNPNDFIDEQKLDTSGIDTLWEGSRSHFLKDKTFLSDMGYTLPLHAKWDGVAGPFNMPVNLQLAHNQNFIQFHFNSLDITPHDTIWYRYKLIGADTAWSPKTASTMSRNYFSLAPGDYTFEVVAKASGKNWGQPTGFSFTIKSPWWQTWWAYLLYAIAFSGTVWAFVYYRSKQLLREKRILEHKVHIRTEEVMQQKEEIEAQRDNLEKAFADLKNTQSQLVQSEKLASLGELTAGIAHEIQNPLNFVNNFAEVSIELVTELKEERDKDVREPGVERELMESLEQNLQKITLHGKRADGIVKNMLQHSRNNSGEREFIDINNLADEYLRLSYHGLRAKDKSFNSAMETQLDGNLPQIKVVPQDIGRVLLNLFNNAFYAVHHKKKQTGQGYQPQVILTTQTKKGIVEIKVRDNGNGIPEAIRDKILQPFFTTKPTGEGTGLGLSLSFEIVKGHGGNLSIDTKEGEFTEFTISLPVS